MTDILFHAQDGVAVITFNRPAALNAFHRTMFHQLLELLADIAHDDAQRVVLLTGAGRAFSAGIDLDEVAHLVAGATDTAQARAELEAMQELTRRMVGLAKPIIAAVNGIAVGVGAEIAIASDIRIAAETASFAFAEVQRGLFETNGVLYRLPRLVGLGRAAHALLTGAPISAQAALAMGLVTHVTAAAALPEAALALARQLAANAPIPLRLVKQALNRTYDLDLAAMMQLETEGALACLASADLREGVRAFAERRAPVFTGK